MRERLDAFGGRRFLLTAASGAVASGLQYAGKLDPAGTSWALVVIGTVAAYITGGTTESIKGKFSDKQPTN